jgi:RNA polymerase sigma-70 factor (ECF subfamily)
MSLDTDQRDPRSQEFVRLLALHERRLAVCVMALVPHWSDAEEVLQETKLRLWEQFDLDNPPHDFGAWSRTVARYMVLTHRKRAARKPAQLSEEALEAVAADFSDLAEGVELRRAALADCLMSLSSAGRELLQRSYASGTKIRHLAKEVGQTPEALYKSLERLRRKLFLCVEERVRTRNK